MFPTHLFFPFSFCGKQLPVQEPPENISYCTYSCHFTLIVTKTKACLKTAQTSICVSLTSYLFHSPQLLLQVSITIFKFTTHNPHPPTHQKTVLALYFKEDKQSHQNTFNFFPTNTPVSTTCSPSVFLVPVDELFLLCLVSSSLRL